MERIKTILAMAFLFSIGKTSAQAQVDPILDTCANFSENVSYDTGEVYVMFSIQNEEIVSKDVAKSNPDKTVPSLESVMVYPNPVSGILTIDTSYKTPVHQISLFGMDGRKVLERTVQNNRVDLTGLPSGSYILKTDISESLTFKIIKQ